MSKKVKDPFLGFKDSTCPTTYFKYTNNIKEHQKPCPQRSKSVPPVPLKKAGTFSGKKFVNCGKCENCTHLPCGICLHCVNSRQKQRCMLRKCVLNPVNFEKQVEVKDEVEDMAEYPDEYDDDVLDQMLNKLLTEGAHKEALFKDLLVYKYWKLRPEPSPDELVSLAKLLNMTMEGIQQIMNNSNSDLLTILPTTSAVGESSVDCLTARKKIMEILEKYPKERIPSLSESKKLRLDLKRGGKQQEQRLETVLHKLKLVIDHQVTGYSSPQTQGLPVSVLTWLEALYLFLNKNDLSSLDQTKGLQTQSIQKLTSSLLAGNLPEPVMQCLIDNGIDCSKYMKLNYETLAIWTKLEDLKKIDVKPPSSDCRLHAIQIKEEPIEQSDLPSESKTPKTNSKTIPELDIIPSSSNDSQVEDSPTADTIKIITHTSKSEADTAIDQCHGSFVPSEKRILESSEEIEAETNLCLTKDNKEIKCSTNDDKEVKCLTNDNEGVKCSTNDKKEVNSRDPSHSNNTIPDMERAQGESFTLEKVPVKHLAGARSVEIKVESDTETKSVFDSGDVQMIDETDDSKNTRSQDDSESKSVEDVETRSKRRAVKKRSKSQLKKPSKKEENYQKLEGGLVNLLWRETSLDQVWTEGYFIPTTEYGASCPELCYLCGSSGKTSFIYCFACAEPFHKYCLDIDDNDVISSDWRCERCIMCQVCNKGTEEMLLKCCECYHTFHAGCLPTHILRVPSKNGVWKCDTCLFCRKCGAKGNSDTKWVYDYSVCKPCAKLHRKGNYCPLCEAVYEDEDYDTPMVSCQSCEHWVHIECEMISELEYEAMSNLPEDRVVYVCKRCCKDSVWKQQMIKCIQENLAHCIEAMGSILDQSKIRVYTYQTVKSIRQFEVDVFQYIASTPGAVGTFRTVLNECFPWYSKVKKGAFDAKTPVKTPKKIHRFEAVACNKKVPQSYKSSSFVGVDKRQCVLCTQKGDTAEGGCGRLLMCGVDNWIHVNCALWSSEVYEESDGKLMNVEMAVSRGASLRCDHCGIYNATVGCCDKQCPRSYHFNCGMKSGAVFLADKRLFCKFHKKKHSNPNWEEMPTEDFIISRRIFIDPAKIGSFKRNARPIDSSSMIPLVGASRITQLGDIMNISDHPDILIPIGYTLERLFWSFRDPAYRCVYRCSVLKEIPEDPDAFLIELSTPLLDCEEPFVDWPERSNGKFGPSGDFMFELTLTIQQPQLNSFNSDSFADVKACEDGVPTPKKVAKTPVKVRAKLRHAREEPLINLDGVKVKKNKARNRRENNEVQNTPAPRPDIIHRIKRTESKSRPAETPKLKEVREEPAVTSSMSLQRARKAALELQRLRLVQEERFRIRRYARLDHSYGVPDKSRKPSLQPLEYEKHQVPQRVRPGYYIDCISANEGIKSLLQRVGGDDSERCCGIPYLDPKIVYMYEDTNGNRCIKMVPPFSPEKTTQECDFDTIKEKNLKIVRKKYNMSKKKKGATSSVYLHRKTQESKHHQQQRSGSLYNSNQFKSRVIQQINAYSAMGGDPQKIIKFTSTSDDRDSSYQRIYPKLTVTPLMPATVKQMSPADLTNGSGKYVPVPHQVSHILSPHLTSLKGPVSKTSSGYISIPGSRFSTHDDRKSPGYSPIPGSMFSTHEDLKSPGSRFSTHEDLKSPSHSSIPGSRFSTHEDLKSPGYSSIPGSKFSTHEDLKSPGYSSIPGSRFSSNEDVKRVSPHFRGGAAPKMSLSPNKTPQKVTPPKRLASQLKQIKKSYSNEKSTIFKVTSAKTIADHSSTEQASTSYPQSSFRSTILTTPLPAPSIKHAPESFAVDHTIDQNYFVRVYPKLSYHSSLPTYFNPRDYSAERRITSSGYRVTQQNASPRQHVPSPRKHNVLSRKHTVSPAQHVTSPAQLVTSPLKCTTSEERYNDSKAIHSIVIKNSSGNSGNSHSLKNKTGSVMRIGTLASKDSHHYAALQQYSSLTETPSSTSPFGTSEQLSGTEKKVPKSQFGVFDFDPNGEEGGAHKFVVTKIKKKSSLQNTAITYLGPDGKTSFLKDSHMKDSHMKDGHMKDGHTDCCKASSDKNMTLKLATSSVPSWIKHDERAKYESIDVDSWLKSDVRKNILAKKAFAFDSPYDDSNLAAEEDRKCNEFTTFASERLRKSMTLEPEMYEPPQEIIAGNTQKIASKSGKVFDRDALLSDFDLVLQKYERSRKAPPETLSILDEETEKDKKKPVPMDISPTLLPSFRDESFETKAALKISKNSFPTSDKATTSPVPSFPDTKRVTTSPVPSFPDTKRVTTSPVPSFPDTKRVTNSTVPPFPDTKRVTTSTVPPFPDTKRVTTSTVPPFPDTIRVTTSPVPPFPDTKRVTTLRVPQFPDTTRVTTLPVPPFPDTKRVQTEFFSKAVKRVKQADNAKIVILNNESSSMLVKKPGSNKTETLSFSIENIAQPVAKKSPILSSKSCSNDAVWSPIIKNTKIVTYKYNPSLKDMLPKKGYLNNPEKSPSPAKELLRDFLLEKETKRTLTFDTDAWKDNKMNKSSFATTKSPQETQNQKLVDSFAAYNPPKLSSDRGSLTENLKSYKTEDFRTTFPTAANVQQSLLAALNSPAGPLPLFEPRVTVLQSGHQGSSPVKVSLPGTSSILTSPGKVSLPGTSSILTSPDKVSLPGTSSILTTPDKVSLQVTTSMMSTPGKVSLQEIASMLSTSMELYETYPETKQVSLTPHVKVLKMQSPDGNVIMSRYSGYTSSETTSVEDPTLKDGLVKDITDETKLDMKSDDLKPAPGLLRIRFIEKADDCVKDVKIVEDVASSVKSETYDLLPVTISDQNVCTRHVFNEFATFQSKFTTHFKSPNNNISEKALHSLEALMQIDASKVDKTEIIAPYIKVKREAVDPVKDALHLTDPSKQIKDKELKETLVQTNTSKESTILDKHQDAIKPLKSEIVISKQYESPTGLRSKRRSAAIASQNLVEKTYKDEDLAGDDDEIPWRKGKRKCDRQAFSKTPSPTKTPLKKRSTTSNVVKLKLQVSQRKNRTYIRCRNQHRDASEKSYPVFVVASEDGVYVEADDADDAWTIVSTLVQRIRKTKHQSVLHGLAMWTLAHDSVVHVIEQLPNTHRLEDYSFHFPEHGPQRSHINKVLPVPVGGTARTMPVVRKSYIDQFSFLNHPHRNIKPPSIDDNKLAVAMGDNPYNRRTTSLGDLPMAMRYRHIMRTVKEVLCVCPSAIHGRGLYCMQDISIGEMIIEYSGTLIRPILCDYRERYYDSKGIGSYMFRINENEVVDATMSGSMARFINHSCDPNCYSRIINVEGKKKIIIFAERNIVKGEELVYDYKFPSEDVKIPCLCSSEKCRKWMN